MSSPGRISFPAIFAMQIPSSDCGRRSRRRRLLYGGSISKSRRVLAAEVLSMQTPSSGADSNGLRAPDAADLEVLLALSNAQEREIGIFTRAAFAELVALSFRTRM